MAPGMDQLALTQRFREGGVLIRSRWIQTFRKARDHGTWHMTTTTTTWYVMSRLYKRIAFVAWHIH